MKQYFPEYDRIEIKRSVYPDYPASAEIYYKDNKVVKTSFTDEKNNYRKIDVFENGKLVFQEEKEFEEYKTQYFKDGKLHKEDGPAVVIRDMSGFQYHYYKNGLLHNEDEPAIVFSKFPYLNEWYIDGQKLTESEIFIQKLTNMRNSSLETNSEKNSNKPT